MAGCKLGITFDQTSLLYSFPTGNPMNSARLAVFSEYLEGAGGKGVVRLGTSKAKEKDLLLFHLKEYVERVKEASVRGHGELGSEDTPAFEGIYEASLFPVGNTLNGLRALLRGEVEHFFNPVGGLHHAAPGEARGFCVFNDSVIAISRALGEYGMKRVAYVDIDAHHGDGVYYEFEPDPRVVIGDVHEDGHFLYPGTGDDSEAGTGFAAGTKMNICLPPGAGDVEFRAAFDRVEDFVRSQEPEMIFFQCGADGLKGDPITHLTYSGGAHAYAAKKMHLLAHEICKGRILAMGGGGYNPANVSEAWSRVVEELAHGV